MPQELINRDALESQAKLDSALADMKQHADKLIHGFEEEDKNHPKRAIWELVQNARDLSEACDMEIEYTSQYLKFTHNGKPFTPRTLLSLIKQVSSKNDDKLNAPISNNGSTEVDEVGQYGTGFITTHTFGKKFLLNGSLEIAEGMYITLENFEIDRVAQTSAVLAGKLLGQQKKVFDLLKETGTFTNVRQHTSFTYLFDDDRQRRNALEAIACFTIHYIPIVMTLNRRIRSIKIINANHNTKDLYEISSLPIEDGTNVFEVRKNGQYHQNIFALQQNDLEMMVLLPLSTRNQASNWARGTARLFLHFPLVDTEEWGGNFIIHCGKFAPTEKRNGLHLKSDRTQTKEKEESNRALIQKATELILGFLRENGPRIANPIILAKVDFPITKEESQLNDYYKSLKEEWVKGMQEIPLVETERERITPAKAAFLDPQLCVKEAPADAIYKVLYQFWENLPKQALSAEWTEIVMQWKDPNMQVVGITEVAQKIHEAGCLDNFDEGVLREFYTFVLQNFPITTFEENKLLPNIKRKFQNKSILYTADAIHPRFIEIADIIVPDVPEHFILKSFELVNDLTAYTRKKLSKDWNARLLEIAKNITFQSLLNDSIRDALIRLCSIFPSLDKKGFRGEIMELIISFYNQTPDYIEVPNITDDEMDYETPMRCLLKHFLFDIHKKSINDTSWVTTQLPFLIKIIQTISGSGSSAYEDLIKQAPVFPDQNLTLKLQDDLHKEEDIPEELKELYASTIGPDIRNLLAYNEIASYLPKPKIKQGLVLAGEINAQFEQKGRYDEILNHPERTHIYSIMKHLIGPNGELWKRLFPVIFEKRETIMMSRITKEEVKDSMFNILGLEDEPAKILMLGELAQDTNMMRIVDLGRKSLEQETYENANFEFKKAIGVHTEHLLLDRIKNEIDARKISVSTLSQQDGQDIVVKYKNGDVENVIYYLEVKAHWDTKTVVTMSRNQINQAIRHADKYSLCVADLVPFYPEGSSRHFPEDINLILHLIKVRMDIGHALASIVGNAVQPRTDEDGIQLTGDYRATVPKAVYSKGIDFLTFIDNLAGILEKRIKELSEASQSL